MKCKIGKQCVLSEKWCNFRVDCMDGSDEINCGKFCSIEIVAAYKIKKKGIVIIMSVQRGGRLSPLEY